MATREFGGTEPLVGEITGLRTFRVDDCGLLLPLYADGCWYDGPNTAACSPPTYDRRRIPHAVPDDDCECGFYAYGSVEAARRNGGTRHVQAVVACWGGVLAGTRGFRAQHARIEAIWLAPGAPTLLSRQVAARYPSARMYDDVDEMLARHPLTPLDCYELPTPPRPLPRVGAAVAAAVMLVLGLLPSSVLHASPLLWTGWLLVTAASAAATGWLLLGSRSVGHLAAAFVMAGVVGWLLAPLFGLAGWLLRVPLLRGMAIGGAGYLLGLRRHHFPVVTTSRPRAFRGVQA